MILTGRMMGAEEAERAGLVARVFPKEQLMDEVLKTAETIAGYSKTTAMVAREAVDRAQETGLREGIRFEQRTYYALWATADAQEGMAAFIEKRDADFRAFDRH
ncbi:MAG: enoyl-CoA hydratase-related protein, partial [Chloroflexota bacterium]